MAAISLLTDTFFAHWPHGDSERAWLGQVGHREQLDEGSKEYRLGEGQLPQPISVGEKAVVELVSAATVGLGCDLPSLTPANRWLRTTWRPRRSG